MGRQAMQMPPDLIPQSDAAILKPIQIVNEANRLARHAIRKAFEASRDYKKAYGTSLIEDQSLELQSFILNMEERASRGYERL